MSENLTPKQRRAIESLLTAADTTQAAAASGVSRETIYRWMRSPIFRDALKVAGAAALAEISRGLVGTAKKAVRELDKVLDGNEPGAVKLRAADITITHAARLTDLVDLEARISELERRLT